jgi:enamine deaminase RidA (YjgF/YER057c/UK114 family)
MRGFLFLKPSNRQVHGVFKELVEKMSKIEDRLLELGEKLPPPKTPVANYIGCKRSGDILYVSGRVSEIRGEVGSEIDLPTAQAAAKGALLDLLAIIKAEIGDLDLILSVEKLNGFVRSAPTFTQQPQVIDGASDLLVALFGEVERHARTATGAAQLPYGAAVQIEMILRLKTDAL